MENKELTKEKLRMAAKYAASLSNLDQQITVLKADLMSAREDVLEEVMECIPEEKEGYCPDGVDRYNLAIQEIKNNLKKI